MPRYAKAGSAKFAILALLSTTVGSVFSATMSRADVIQYSFQNVSFQDGGSVLGTFNIDSTSGYVLATNFITTYYDGSTTFTYIYQNNLAVNQPGNTPASHAGDPLFSFDVFANVSDHDHQYYINFLFENPLTAGGTNPIVYDHIILNHGYSYECDNCNGVRYITGGQVVGALVDTPEPMSIALLGVGLVGLHVSRRRR